MRFSRLFAGSVSLVAATFLCAETGRSGRLTFQQRVSAQRMLERLEYGYRVGATKPFEQVIPYRVSEDRVRATLARATALASYWATPVTQAMLQKELERIARDTRLPARLEEIYAALNHDPFLVREAFVLPRLVERLVRERVSTDERIQAHPRAQAGRLRADLMTGRLSAHQPHPLRDLVERPAADTREIRPAPDAVGPLIALHDAFRFEVLLEQDGGSETVAVYRIGKISFEKWWSGRAKKRAVVREDTDPGIDTLLPHPVHSGSLAAEPAGLSGVERWDNGILDDVASPRTGHTAVWTGTHLIVWGGTSSGQFEITNTGARYDPVSDTWSPVSTADAPSPRMNHSAVWTGQEMIVWGGAYPNLDTGGRYDPVSDSWMTISTLMSPSARRNHTAIWTGTRMIIWGGFDAVGAVGTGASYDPATDAWQPTTMASAPGARALHTAVWTGTEMILWGGVSDTGPLQTGSRYRPSPELWTPISTTSAPAPRQLHTAVWTGGRMLIWGGFSGSGQLATGGQYDPGLDSWTPTAITDAPPARYSHTAIWTGSRMLVWGGFPAQVVSRTGAQYDPAADVWTPTSITNAPSPRSDHTAVWTGSVMIAWGGRSSGGGAFSSGGRYDPVANSWTPTATMPAGSGPAVWTGSEMIIFAGPGSSGRYDPLADTWAPVSTLNRPPSGTAVWTGTDMITWSGGAGGRYNPDSDAWTPITNAGAPFAGRGQHSAIWSGNSMIVFGGDTGAGGFEVAPTNRGGSYNPVVDAWVQTPLAGAPAPRAGHTAVWTGTAMIVWGGYGTFWTIDPDGASFNPATGVWTPIDTTGDPSPRTSHTAVWTGREMIVWGGIDDPPLGDGARYDPASDAWTPMTITNAPGSREEHSAIWTGTEMIVWGGGSFSDSGTGGRYNPRADEWTQVATDGAPRGLSGHAAVWTGDTMIVWSGISGGGRYYFMPPFNEPPQAVVTGDGPVECGGFGGQSVTLDGSGSYDPEGGILSYEWFELFGYPGYERLLGTGPTLSLHVSVRDLDQFPITLRVTDVGGATSIKTVQVYERDSTPPQINCPTAITAECAGPETTPVQLPPVTASDACDPDISFSRAESPENVPFASNNFVYGTTLVTYTAQPTFGPSASCIIAVTVQDTTPPALSVGATPRQLWPANHRMVEVNSVVSATDTCGATDVILGALTSSEPDDAPGNSDGSTISDIQQADIGTTDLQFLLRAELDRKASGRIYTITYEAIDAAGLRTATSAVVTVPLPQSRLQPRQPAEEPVPTP